MNREQQNPSVTEEELQKERLERFKFMRDKSRVNFQEIAKIPDAKPVITGFGGFPIMMNGASMTVVHGATGMGKTSFIVTALFGGYADKHKKVLWLDTEQPAPAVKKTLWKIATLQGTNIEHIRNLEYYCFRGEDPDNAVDFLRYCIEDFKPDYIVIDNLADLVNDGTSDTEIRILLQRLIFPIIDEFSIGMFIVLHNNRSGQIKGHNGTICIEKADIAIEVTEDSFLKHTKNRYGLRTKCEFRFSDQGLLEWFNHVDTLPTDRKGFCETYLNGGEKYKEKTIRQKYEEWKKALDPNIIVTDEDWETAFHDMLGREFVSVVTDEDGNPKSYFGKYLYITNI